MLYFIPFFISTSNHNYEGSLSARTKVVPYSASTSNHNIREALSVFGRLYLILLLHQITTFCQDYGIPYVVPYSASTSNHNSYAEKEQKILVVPYSASTSNHNTSLYSSCSYKLFLIPILHQITTLGGMLLPAEGLFLIPILHQITTRSSICQKSTKLFLIPILHQITTVGYLYLVNIRLFLIPILHQITTFLIILRAASRCTLFCFYIKSQLVLIVHRDKPVVPYSASTSNHNLLCHGLFLSVLYLILLLHQITTHDQLLILKR